MGGREGLVGLYVQIYNYIFRYMLIYSKEEKLKLVKQIAVTKEVYNILRKQKQKQKISLAKIVCNLVIEKYAKQNN
jgi:hypothetical protein